MADEKQIHIGEIEKGNIVVSISEFQGKKYLDIRKYYEENGELKPTKKGIALNREQFEAVFTLLEKNKDKILSEMQEK